MKKFLVMLLVVFLVPCYLWAAQGIKVTWNANTESDLAGYKVYFAKPGDPGWAISADTISYTLGTLPNSTPLQTLTEASLLFGDGPYAVAVTAIDSTGNESPLSEIKSVLAKDPEEPVVIEVPPINLPPAAPTQIIINIIGVQ